MRSFEVYSSLTYPAVAALKFPSLELRQRTMHAYEEHINMAEQAEESIHPCLRLNDMLYDEVVTCICQRGKTAMEAIKKLRPVITPWELSTCDAFLWKNACDIQMIDREMPEWFVHFSLQRTGKRGLAGTGCAIKKYDLTCQGSPSD